jgi:4-alpha-glucanotransferase
LQDLLAMSGPLRREDPFEERINVPANPKHYWRYRMHLSVEALLDAEEFNTLLLEMLRASGRAGRG